MQKSHLVFTGTADAALFFKYEDRKYLYAGRKGGYMYGIATATDGKWRELVGDAADREYESVGRRAVELGLDFVTFDLEHIKIDTEATVKDAVEQRDELDDLAISTIGRIDRRSKDGATIGLIDGMIAMARVLRKANLGSVEVQEALKDFTADEDVKWLMENSVQDWDFPVTPEGQHDFDQSLEAPVVEDLAKPSDWPEGMQFRAEVKFKTWPMGWDRDVLVKHFATREELDAYIASQAEWAKSEDNEVQLKVYDVANPDQLIADRHYG